MSLARKGIANQSIVPPSSESPPRAYFQCTFVPFFFCTFLCLHHIVPVTKGIQMTNCDTLHIEARRNLISCCLNTSLEHCPSYPARLISLNILIRSQRRTQWEKCLRARADIMKRVEEQNVRDAGRSRPPRSFLKLSRSWWRKCRVTSGFC